MHRKEDAMRKKDEAGLSLIEVVVAIVILGGIVSALMGALVTSSTTAKTHRDLVSADAVLRDYAEATKAAVRASCASAGATYSVTYTPPSGFTVGPSLTTARPCPSVTTVEQLELSVTGGSATTKRLTIAVRSR
jgi:Tfp pilus assembly protein PilV